MRTAALVIGIIGAVFGIITALLALALGGLGGALNAQGAGTVVGLGWSAFIFDILGFIGAGFATAKPRLSAVLLLVAGVGYIISISWFAIITGPLFLIAALFAFLGRQSVAQQTTG